ncbi:DUF3825 domain-containing protein [Olsenella profusa]|uniref:DUF3825 domain-containing protein n=1 Tax=Olsenella profusa TaxID=138595 RepID=A0ABS2F2W0_9ACTN|nr:DUF3825 domain-containing protein [Olsenella profusa]MBM6775168.1 DUF3825 domain-containing protein [Olsenella profusa]
MPKITPGNRLYLYRLLSRSIGVGRQTLMPHVEEALTADGISPEDLGCTDMRALCEQLPEFIKLTVFKKGYVYATVVANEEYDRALERAASGADKAATKGKPWKRKGGKLLKPVKPRHVEHARPDVAPTDADGEKDAVAVAAGEKDAVAAARPEVEAMPAPEAAPVTVPAAETETEPTPGPDQTPAPVPEPEAAPGPDPTPAPAPEPEPTPDPAPMPVPEAAHEPTAAPAHEPAHSINLTITYVPEDADERQPEAETAEGARPRPQSDLPHDFHADVRCSSEQLSILYQALPANVDPLATLEEDFRVARSTGTLEGTRSNVTFPLRYLQHDGTTPVRVTLRRSARPVAGKRWALTEVDAGELDDVDLSGLSAAARGAWTCFPGRDDADPERAFVQTVAIGSWDEVLDQLAGIAVDEPWGASQSVLRDYLIMTFARVRAEGKLAAHEDGRTADFDTGLLAESGDPIHAQLTRLGGDIPWRLDGFSTKGAGRPARYVTSLAQAVFDPTLSAPDFTSARAASRSPRLSTAAYDPLSNEVYLLVPDDGSALALAVTPRGYEAVASLPLSDAYACARVVSSDQPAWLAESVAG